MGTISYISQAGNLVPNLIWQFGIATDWEESLERGLVFGEWTGVARKDELHECPIDKLHVTYSMAMNLRLELHGGRKLPEFLGLTNHAYAIVSRDFSKKMKDSHLSGLRFIDGVETYENDNWINSPEFLLFEVSGKAGFCLRWKIEDAPNLCPYCEKEPILCKGCGWRSFFDCPRCGKRVHHGGGYIMPPDGKNLLFQGNPKQWIVDASSWDGSDFFQVRGHGGGWFVNRRGKKWLDDANIQGIKFAPALLNVEGFKNTLPDRSVF